MDVRHCARRTARQDCHRSHAAANVAGVNTPKNISLTARTSSAFRSIKVRPARVSFNNTARPSFGSPRLIKRPACASLPVSVATKALETVQNARNRSHADAALALELADRHQQTYCGALMPMRLPRCSRTMDMRVAMVRRSWTSRRKRSSEPRSSRADTVGGSRKLEVLVRGQSAAGVAALLWRLLFAPHRAS